MCGPGERRGRVDSDTDYQAPVEYDQTISGVRIVTQRCPEDRGYYGFAYRGGDWLMAGPCVSERRARGHIARLVKQAGWWEGA